MSDNPFTVLARKVADNLDADILLYFGDINAEGADGLCKEVRKKKRKNILLMLATFGGDPDAAYRMARRIQRTYGTRDSYKSADAARFFVFIPTVCKSAGTLIALGADKILIARDAEVGPIDIQLRKHDEVGERASGLLPSEALSALTGRARLAFLQHFRALRTDRALPFSTKLAAEVAGNVTVGLFTPIFEQLDPIRLAEMERSQRIAAEYGKRLDVGNLKERALVRLLGDYPSHSFIIDSDEMKEIFKEVAEADENLENLSDGIEVIYRSSLSRETPLVLMLNTEVTQGQDEDVEDRTEGGARQGPADGASPRGSRAGRSGIPKPTGGRGRTRGSGAAGKANGRAKPGAVEQNS